MREFLPNRKVLAACLMATVATVYLTVTGEGTLETVTAVWLPVAAAYAKA